MVFASRNDKILNLKLKSPILAIFDIIIIMTQPNLTKNTTYYTAALILQKILAFIYFWFISNRLFPGELGQYVFALSFTTLFSIFVDLGLTPILTREASKDKLKANAFLQSVLGLKIPLAILTIIAAWITITLTHQNSQVQLLVYLASIIMILDSFSLSFWVIFRSRHNLKYESLATILVQIIIFSLGLFALYSTGQVRDLILALMAASIFNFVFVFSFIKFKLKFNLRPKFDWEIIRYFLKILPAFALAGIFIKIYNTNDSILLGYLASDEAVGYFAVPAKVVYALQQIIPAAFAAVIFPAFSYYYAHDKNQLSVSFDKAFNYLTIISFPITAGIIALLPQILKFFWPAYLPTQQTFFLMTLAIPFIFLAFPTGYLLNACDRQKNTTINRGVITALAVILNIILIPKFSFLGAGITFLITNVVLLFMDFFWVAKTIKLDWPIILKIVSKSLLASLIMVLAVKLLLGYFHLIIVIGLGALVYFFILYLVKGVNLAELKELKNKIG